MSDRLRSGRVAIVTTLLAAVLAVAARLDPIAEGLQATYYRTDNWSAAPALTRREPAPSSDTFASAWDGQIPEIFSASWAGSFIVLTPGTYTFSSTSDDGSWVYVDGTAVVDNGGRHAAQARSGTIALDRGAHAISIQYAQQGGALDFRLSWARDGAALAPIPSWMLTPSRRVTFGRFSLSVALRAAVVVAVWLAAFAIAWWLASWAATRLAAARSWSVHEQVWPALGLILGGSVLLNLAGIWWGLPGGGWVPDELTPGVVLPAAAQRFSGGWADRYPPLHFYLLFASFSPVLLLQSFGRLPIDGESGDALLTLAGRLVSVLAAAVTVTCVYLSGARAFGRRAGLAAAGIFALVAPFVYYAKTANVDVPYLCWFALSLVFYLRALDGLRTADVILFAAAAMLAICTKDQAYGLFLLMPLPLWYAIVQANRAAGAPNPVGRAVLDRRLWLAALAAMAIFAVCHNLLFNWRGFVEHVRFITGGAPESYRQFERSTAGRLALAGLTLDIIRAAMGWPFFVVGVAGACLGAIVPRYRRAALIIALPALTYYAGFINVLIYNYDRFMLPACLSLAIFGGLALDRFLAWRAPAPLSRPLQVAFVGALFVYTLLYAATVDVLMLRDSRYAVEQWMAPRRGADDWVGFAFPRTYVPRLGEHSLVVNSVDELESLKPRYYVLNAEYALAEPAGSPLGAMIASLRAGRLEYRLAYSFRQPSPWPWLPDAHRDLVGPRTDLMITSSLRHINPRFEVYERVDQHGARRLQPSEIVRR